MVGLRVPARSEIAIQLGKHSGQTAQYTSATDFYQASGGGKAQGLGELGKGLGKFGEAVFNLGIERRERIMKLDLLKDIQTLKASSQSFIDDYQQQYKGRDAVDAEQSYTEYTLGQADFYKKKWEDNDRALLYLEQYAGEISLAGANTMRDYGNGQMKEYEGQIYQADISNAMFAIESDPANWQASTAGMIGTMIHFNSEKPKEWQEAQAREIYGEAAKQAHTAFLARNDFAAAEAIEEGYASFDSPSILGMGFAMPVVGARLSSPYGEREAPAEGASDFHRAVDLAAPDGTPVNAFADGEIISMGRMGGYGNAIVIKHGNGSHETQYGHLGGFANGLQVGSAVKKGQMIGMVGSTGVSTGPHLDFKLKKNGEWIDPSPFLGIKKKGASAATGGGPDSPSAIKLGNMRQERYKAYLALDTIQEAEIKRLSAEAQKELTEMRYGLDGKKLTMDEVTARRDILSPADFDKYMKIVQEGEAPPDKSDPETVLMARRMAVAGDADLQDFIDDAVQNNLMTLADHGSIMNEGQQFRDPPVRAAVRRIESLTGHSELNPDPNTLASRNNAVADFMSELDGLHKANKEPSPDELLKMANRWGNNYRAVADENTVRWLPMPSHPTKADGSTATRFSMDVEATRIKNLEMFDGGLITADQYDENDRRIDSFKEVLEEKAAAEAAAQNGTAKPTTPDRN